MTREEALALLQKSLANMTEAEKRKIAEAIKIVSQIQNPG